MAEVLSLIQIPMYCAGGTALAGRDGIAVAMAAAFFGNYIPWLHAMGWVGAARWKHNVGHPITHIEKADVNDPTARHEYLAWTRGFYNLIEWQFLYIGTQAFLLFTNRPGIAMITSVGWAVGRMLYTSGYARQGAPARQVGLILSVLGGFGPGIGFMWIDIFRFMSK